MNHQAHFYEATAEILQLRVFCTIYQAVTCMVGYRIFHRLWQNICGPKHHSIN